MQGIGRIYKKEMSLDIFFIFIKLESELWKKLLRNQKLKH